MVEGDGDQALAAEPGFRREPPGGGDTALIDRLQLVDPVDGVDADPLKNGPPLPFAETGVRLVMIGLAGGVAAEAAAGAAVERVGDGEQIGRERPGLPEGGLREAFAEGERELADALLDGAVVARIARRAVERDDAVRGKDGIDRGVVERAAVVALEEERSPVAAEQFSQMRGHRRPPRLEGRERREAIPRAKILHDVDLEPAAPAVPAPLGHIERPGEVRPVPDDALAGLPARRVPALALPSHEAVERPAGDALPHLVRRRPLEEPWPVRYADLTKQPVMVVFSNAGRVWWWRENRPKTENLWLQPKQELSDESVVFYQARGENEDHSLTAVPWDAWFPHIRADEDEELFEMAGRIDDRGTFMSVLWIPSRI